ncbi:MAG: SMP-30/gluconolactonase/LRE family protein [Polaromonas sp.]
MAGAARRVGKQLSVNAQAPSPAEPSVLEGPWAFRGEFARWSIRHGCLFWADSLAPSVRRFDGRQDRELAVFDAPLTALLVWKEALLAGSLSGYWRIDNPDGPLPQVSPLQPWPSGVPSALCAGPAGELWSCVQLDGARWRVGPWPAADENLADCSWTLGEALDALAWDGTGQLLYGLSRESGVILVMQRGQSLVRRLATLPKGSGRLSGLAVDGAGGVWTALQDGWSVVRFSPDGNQDRVIGLPVPCPSDVALGGPHLHTLYVTSARQPVSLEALGNAPLSGRLFCIDDLE